MIYSYCIFWTDIDKTIQEFPSVDNTRLRPRSKEYFLTLSPIPPDKVSDTEYLSYFYKLFYFLPMKNV